MESSSPEKKCTFFALIIPEEDTVITQDKSVIATNLKDLQPLLKRNTHSRFRVFTNFDDAYKCIEFPDTPECGTPSKTQSKPRGRSSLPNTTRSVDTRSHAEERERANKFSTPKPQDMAMLNSYITRRLNNKLSEAINLNPRLLCTDCDVAPSVHEGTRQNALHAAAKNNNYQAAQIILETISSISFFELLYPKGSPVTRSERCRHLNMSYLNTPDKMLLETPLHYAAKFNAIDVLKLLVIHPLCNLDPRNDQGQTPVEIAGSRCSGPNSVKDKNEVVRLLQEIYIVPIWRDVLNATPRVGIYGKWHSYRNKLPKSFNDKSFNIPVELLPPFDDSLVPFSKSGYIAEISSYAGPTTEEKAKEFYRLLKDSSGRKIADNPLSPFGSPGPNSPKHSAWSTPPMSSPIHSPAKVLSGSPITSKDLVLPTTPSKLISIQSKADMSLRMEDGVKGLERLCRKYAKQLNIPWTEYWTFLDAYCNLESRFGLELLESFLLSKENEVDATETYSDPYDDGDGTLVLSGNSSWSWSSKVKPSNKNNEFGDTMCSDTLSTSSRNSDDTIDLLIEKLDSMHINSPSSPVHKSQSSTEPRRLSFNPGEYLIEQDRDDDDDELKCYLDEYYLPFAEIRQNTEMDIVKTRWDYRDLANTSNSTIDTDIDCSFNALSDVSMETKDNVADDDDRFSFITAATHEEADEDDFEECCNCIVYIDGTQPKENDRQVFYAIKDIINDDILTQYPAISRWYNSLKSNCYFKTKDQTCWNFSTPRRHFVGAASPLSEDQQAIDERYEAIRGTKRALQF